VSLLAIENLAKNFGGFRAVDGVSFDVAAGTIHAVIGPNGAGKTTMFNLMTGHLRPSEGLIDFDGMDITGRRPSWLARRGLVRAFQITNVFPRLSVLENVECAVIAQQRVSGSLLFRHRSRTRRAAAELLEAVSLTHTSGAQAMTLSHGDQRTLEVALALATQPRLLLLDEPTAGMSPWETERMVELVRGLARSRGLTVLFCEHDMDVVFNISDRVTVLHQGRVIADGAPPMVRSDRNVISVYLGESRA